MQRVLSIIKAKKGSSLIEVLLAVTVFALFVTAVSGGILYGQDSARTSGTRQRALRLAEEGLEAVRSIRDGGYSGLPVDGTYGLAITANKWTLTGSSDTSDIFTRTVVLSTPSTGKRKVVVTVSWNQGAGRTGQVVLEGYATDWLGTTSGGGPTYRKGMLVYADGGTTSDAIKYQIYDDSTGTWGAVNSTADIDGATTNKYLRRAELYSSSTRDEKILISRHYNGTAQWIYAQVYNGTTGTWGNVNQLSTWTATTFLDVKNFGGTYLANGNFVVLYSDNTTTPKFKTWNGTAWSTASGVAGTATPVTGGIPCFITLKQRPGTNEAMAVLFDTSSDTNSLYFWIGANGTYETADWVLSTEHSATAPLATKQLADFDWSSTDPTKGAIVYTDTTTDKQMNIKIWTANGAGSGAWGATAQYGTAQTNNIGALSINAVVGTNTFVACDKDALATPLIICMRADTAGWIASSNTTIAAATNNGIHASSDIGFSQLLPTYGIGAYSDNTGILKYKKYTIGTNTWDAAATSVNGTAVGVIRTARVIPNPTNKDMMVIVSDANLDIYSVIFDGTNSNMFTAPAGKAWLVHGINGSAITDTWYDFEWDNL
jgi:Tfp pilus assembly protein PilV